MFATCMENATSCTTVVQRVLLCDKTNTNNGIESVHMIIQDYANEKIANTITIGNVYLTIIELTMRLAVCVTTDS